MFLIRLYLFVFVNLFLYGKCSIPVEKLCVTQTCEEPISMAQGKVLYLAKDTGELNFERGQKMKIISKGKNQNDYWEAVINGKKGYVPSHLVREIKMFQKDEDLIIVPVKTPQQNVSNKKDTPENPSDGKVETENLNVGQQSEAVLNSLKNTNNLDTLKKEIKPSGATFTVIEGTTIYADEPHGIKPSVTVEVKSTHTAAPVNSEVNKKPVQQDERATIPPEVINLNSNFNGGNIASNFTIETVKEDDDNAKVESKGVYTDRDEDESDDDEEDEEGYDDKNDEEEDDGADESDDEAETPEVEKFAKATSQNVDQKVARDSATTPPNGKPIVQNMGQMPPAATPQSGFAAGSRATYAASQPGIATGPEAASQNLGENIAEINATVRHAGVGTFDNVKQQNLGQQKMAEFPATANELNDATATASDKEPILQMEQKMAQAVNAPSQSTAGTNSEATPSKMEQMVTQQTSFVPQPEPVLQNLGQMPVAATPQSGFVAGGRATYAASQPGIATGPAAASQNFGENIAETHATTPQPGVGAIGNVKQQILGQQKLAEFPATGNGLNDATATPPGREPTLQMGQKMAEAVTATSQSTVGKNSEATPSKMEQMVTQQSGFVPQPEPVLQNIGQMPAAATPQSGFVAGGRATYAASQPGIATGSNAASQNLEENLVKTSTKTSQTSAGMVAEGNYQNMGQNVVESFAPTPQSINSEAPPPKQQIPTETSSVTPQAGAGINAEETLQNMGQTGVESTFGADLETPVPSSRENVNGDPSVPQQVPSYDGSHILGSVTPEAKSEATPSPDVEKTSTIFSEFSVLADPSPKNTENLQEPSLSEVTTEAYGTTFQPRSEETGSHFSQTINKESVTPGAVTDNVEITTEALKPSVHSDVESLPQEEPRDTENSQIPESHAEEPGMLSQITGMFSSWFTSAPGEELTEGKANYEAFQDIRADGKAEAQIESFNEAPLGTCQNSELGFDCKDFPPAEEQRSFWSDWIPAGLGLEGVLTQSNTVVYLVITAVTVLLFTLGHNFIEKRGKTGPLIAKINKLEHELLVTSKECILLKEEIHAAKEKITLYENSANDELVVSLQAELEESKKVRAELESSIEVLQQELDAATEAGLDLNKMLSEVLTQKGGSETLLKSVESLQAQLDSQQKVIDEMTKKLGVKNQENEALQLALQSANDRSENLEEQLTDIKHNLNLHLKEKEDVTRELNARINHLVTCSNQLWETKEEETSKFKTQMEELEKKLSETSSALTVKEEEVKALKQSMKHLKAKGDVKLETVFDFSRVKAELAKEVKENQVLLEKLQKEENSRKALTEKLNDLESEMQKMKKNYEEAEQKKEEAEKKLEVLSTYFKEKETQLQKELGLQEALWAQKKGDESAVCNMMKSLQEEVESYKSQNETLKKEILDQERGLKNQIASLEQKAHENWVAARQAERKLEEAKQEMSQLRNRLVSVMEKSSNSVDGKGNIRSTEELNGVEAASPILHDTSSPLLFPPLPLDPNGSNLLPPGFMPPPMFIPPPMGGFMPPPPFLPGDRRPPPLGRMSSPPLNNRFSPSSPADYPFERMSSPPLSPPGSNYRSLNDDRDHYRHRTPPYPPPLHPRNWDDSNEIPGFIPISSQRDSRRDHKGSNVSSEHSSSESLDKSSRHSGRV